MTGAAPTIRTYEAAAESTDVFGRVLARIRHHELVIDGPVQNGCLGEAPTPAELILAAAASCGAELMQVLARDGQIPLESISVAIHGMVDRERQPHANHTVFTEVTLRVRMRGPSAEEAAQLVSGFQRRCPVYGSLAVASGHIQVHHELV